MSTKKVIVNTDTANGCYQEYSYELGPRRMTETRESRRREERRAGYSLSRLDLKNAIEALWHNEAQHAKIDGFNYLHTEYRDEDVRYKYGKGPATQESLYVESDGRVSIGCMSFGIKDGLKLIKWSGAKRAKVVRKKAA